MNKMGVETVQSLQASLFEKVETFRSKKGEPTVVSSALRDAFFETPRHQFVERFRRIDAINGDIIRREDAGALEQIYENKPLIYVREDGRNFNASNSEPSFILHLVSLLDIKPGDDVLEVGCGTGWLLAIMARLAGSDARVVGVEVEPELASLASQNLADMGLSNTEVVLGNGLDVSVAGTFDKIIFTTSTFRLPDQLFSLLRDDGNIVVPLQNRGPAEEAFCLNRRGEVLISTTARLCKFVEAVAPKGTDEGVAGIRRLPKSGPVATALASRTSEEDFQLGRVLPNGRHADALPFSSFLSKTEPTFRVFAIGDDTTEPGLDRAVFGDPSTLAFYLADESDGSAVLWHRGVLQNFGSDRAAELFTNAYERWLSLNSPMGAEFSLEVSEINPGGGQEGWLEKRGSHWFRWRL